MAQKYDRKEAAAYLGVATQTLNKWACIGYPHIPYYRLGKKAVYDKDDLDAFLEKNRVLGNETENE